MVGNFSCFLFGHENHSGGQFKRPSGKMQINLYEQGTTRNVFMLICSQKRIKFDQVQSSLIKFDQIQVSLIKFDQV